MDFLDELAASVPRLSGPALCAETDPELFFPEKGGSAVRQAKRTCMRCEIRAECERQALDLERRIGVQHGIWAALTPGERRKMLRRETEAAPKAA